MIEAGLCDAAVVGGADSLCLTTLYGFHALALNAPGPCRPFDAARDGISIGEAAGFALLEKPQEVHGPDDVLLLGVGESNDAYHMSSPHPEGIGATSGDGAGADRGAAVAGAISTTSTCMAPRRAWAMPRKISRYPRCSAADTPCSSTKGQTGHTLGAAGIVEAIVSALAIRHGLLPGSAHTETVDPSFRSRYQLISEPARIDTVLSNSFGFGGGNCSLIFGRAR